MGMITVLTSLAIQHRVLRQTLFDWVFAMELGMLGKFTKLGMLWQVH